MMPAHERQITVPAVWSEGAQEKTRLCAEEAGMGTGKALHIISEPEAAAIYGEYSLENFSSLSVALIHCKTYFIGVKSAFVSLCPKKAILSLNLAIALDIMEPHSVEVGNNIMLCDAGGGTVDLITYTVSALKPRLKITEASTGSGSLCGSSYLNRCFQTHLRKKIGHLTDWDDEVREEVRTFPHVADQAHTDTIRAGAEEF